MKILVGLLLLIIVVLLVSFILLFISRQSVKGLGRYWGDIGLSIETYSFFFGKASAYRKLFTFFTCLSYILRIIGILTTCYLLYCAVGSNYSTPMLVVSSMCDAICLLFPFQKYIDTFAVCSDKMEKTILNCRTINDPDQIFEKLKISYIECEHTIHK
jgi:hypothetical protein